MRTVTCSAISQTADGRIEVRYSDTAGSPLALSFTSRAALIAWLEAAEKNAPLEYLLALAIMPQYRAGVVLGPLYDGARTVTTLDMLTPKVESVAVRV